MGRFLRSVLLYLHFRVVFIETQVMVVFRLPHARSQGYINFFVVIACPTAVQQELPVDLDSKQDDCQDHVQHTWYSGELPNL